MTPSQEEFVPQKIVVGRRGRRRGHHAAPSTTSSDQSTTKQQHTITTNNITSVPLNDTQPQQKQQQKRSTRSINSAPQISSSVVFHEEDTEQLINELANDNNNNIEPSSTTQLSSSQQQASHINDTISSSVIFHEEQIELFDEIDELYPHEHEGGKIVADPHSSTASPPGGISSMLSTTGKGGVMNNSLSGSLTTSRSLASSVIRSLHESNSLSGSKSYNGVLPTDYASLVASSNDGTLAEMVAEMTMARDNSNKQNANWDNDNQQDGKIRQVKSNPNLQQSLLSTLTEVSHEQSTKMSNISGNGSSGSNNKNRRSSIVGGKPISQMTYEEQESPRLCCLYLSIKARRHENKLPYLTLVCLC